MAKKVKSRVGTKSSSGSSSTRRSVTNKNVVTSAVAGSVGSTTDNSSLQQQSQQKNMHRFSRKTVVSYVSDVNEVVIECDLPLHKVAELLGKGLNEVVLMLLQKGMAFTRNQLVPREITVALAHQLSITVLDDVVKKKRTGLSASSTSKQSKNLIERWPVVVVMGHVDHGKTTLLDFIRNASVAAREKGGITQHIGAYKVDTSHGRVVFLDTPGHEAFTSMRGRGVQITDLAILVVAADDGVMPQTIEAIEHAKDAGVPIIVAINKMDKEGAQQGVEAVKRQLAQHDVLVEDWGGQTVCVSISAKTGKGVEDLLEMIVLQAQMLDLKADPKASPLAFVLESKYEQGYGAVSTVIISEGTLKRGDCFICGSVSGKVRLLMDSTGTRVPSAGPSSPVRVVGFDAPAMPGDWLTVVPASEYSKARSSKPKAKSRLPEVAVLSGSGVEGEIFRIVVKADTHGSCDAVNHALKILSSKNKAVGSLLKVIANSVGDVSEGDVLLAADSDATVVGLNVKVGRNAMSVARDQGVDLIIHQVIYHLVEAIEKAVSSRIKVEKLFKQSGKAEVRKVFDIKGRGIIAGCYVSEGVVRRGGRVVCMRNDEKIGESKIVSLQRDRKVVKEVTMGHECGFICEDFKDWKVGDVAVCFIEEEKKSD